MAIFSGIRTILLGFGLAVLGLGVGFGRALVTGALVECGVVDCGVAEDDGLGALVELSRIGEFVGLFDDALGDASFGADVVDTLGLFSDVDPDSFGSVVGVADDGVVELAVKFS